MKLRLFLIVALASTFSWAQIAPSFEDDFDNNKYNWWIGDLDWLKTEMSGGQYKIYNKSDIYTYNLNREFRVGKSEELELTARIKQTGGDENQFMCLTWGDPDGLDNYYALCVASSQYYSVREYVDGQSKDLLSWTQSTMVPTQGNWIDLKITYSKSKSQCYIQDKLVFESKKWKPLGTKIGFRFGPTVELEADFLKATVGERVINQLSDAGDFGEKERLTSKINSNASELAPNISPDGKRLNFARDSDRPIPISEEDSITTSFWYSDVIDNEFSEPKMYGKPFNQFNGNVGSGVTPDGQSMVSGLMLVDGDVTRAIGISQRDKEGWGDFELQDVKKLEELNKGRYVYSFLANDGRTMLFGMSPVEDSQRGNIYVSFKGKKTWSKPKSLGPQINSELTNSGTPILAADGRTLYFSTDGYPGYGDLDVFMTKRLDDSWTRWTEPVNMGPSINDETWNGYFSIPTDGEHAYFVGYPGTDNESDIYRVKLPQSARPDPVLQVRGKVLNSKTKEPISTKIVVHDLTSDKEVGIAYSDPNTGAYSLVLPSGGEYSFFAEKDLFYSVRESQSLKELGEHSSFQQDLLLAPIESGESIVLNNIFFVRSKAVLLPSSIPELDKLVQLMEENPSLKIQIEGHTDNTGSGKANQVLSQQRANKIKDYLSQKGIQKKRLSAQGYGGTRPLNDNSTETLKRKNRRVEFVVQ